jgi:hypothetical protein
MAHAAGEHALRRRPRVVIAGGGVASLEALIGHDQLRELAIEFAESDAAGGDYRSALRWLDTVEQLDAALSPPLAAKREAWRKE